MQELLYFQNISAVESGQTELSIDTVRKTLLFRKCHSKYKQNMLCTYFTFKYMTQNLLCLYKNPKLLFMNREKGTVNNMLKNIKISDSFN